MFKASGESAIFKGCETDLGGVIEQRSENILPSERAVGVETSWVDGGISRTVPRLTQ